MTVTRRTASGKEPVRRRMDTDARREQLLTLGLEVFSARPYDAVSIDDVAAAAGISKGLLYHYFPTKRDFYVAVVRESARMLLDATEPPTELGPNERFLYGLDRYLSFVEQRATAYAALLRGGVGSDAEVAAVVEATRQGFVAKVQDALGPGSMTPRVRTFLRGWVGFVESTSLDWIDRRDLTREELMGVWAEALLRLLPEETRRAQGA